MFDKLQKHVKSQSASDASVQKWRFFAALAIKTDPETLPRAPEARAEKIWRFRSRKVGKLAIFALKRSLFWDFPVKCQIHYFQIFSFSTNSLFSDFPKSAKFIIKFISAPPPPYQRPRLVKPPTLISLDSVLVRPNRTRVRIHHEILTVETQKGPDHYHRPRKKCNG